MQIRPAAQPEAAPPEPKETASVAPPKQEEPDNTPPATVMRPPDPNPDPDDPGRPVLKRGTPAPRRQTTVEEPAISAVMEKVAPSWHQQISHAGSVFPLSMKRELLDFGKQMAGEEYGHAAALRQVPNQGSHFMNAGGVESVGRLIEQQQFRIAE